MKRFILLIITSILIFLFQQCSFKKDLTNPQPLNKKNLSEINGHYEIVESDFDSLQGKRQIWTSNNFLKEIDRKLLKDTLKLDSTKNYYFDLEVIDSKNLRINYIEEDKIIRTRTLKTKLKKDGYLYLKNKNIGFWLVPYVAGALDIKKSRLTRSATGNLLFDVVNHRSGAFLIIAFLDGRTWKYRDEYKRSK